MKIESAIKYLINCGLSEEQIKTIVSAIAINELEVIRASLWDKARVAKYALEADTYLNVINIINERKEYHETNN